MEILLGTSTPVRTSSQHKSFEVRDMRNSLELQIAQGGFGGLGFRVDIDYRPQSRNYLYTGALGTIQSDVKVHGGVSVSAKCYHYHFAHFAHLVLIARSVCSANNNGVACLLPFVSSCPHCDKPRNI